MGLVNRMEFKVISDVKISVLGLGTFGFGGRSEAEHSSDGDYVNVIKEAINLGLTHIDTAEVYAQGHSEELIGEAIKDFDRESLFITSKVYPKKYDKVIESAKKSLERLGIDYLDLYLVHVPGESAVIKETMEAMDKLVEDGLVKNIGVSNFNVSEMKEAQGYCKSRIAANQIKVSLWTKSPPDLETIKYCQDNNIIVIAYKLLGRGRFLTEKKKLVGELAKKYGKTESQVLLNWFVSKKNCVVIFKSLNIEHIKEDLECLGWEMDKEDVEKLDGLVA